jgi:hypothetical protein
LENIEAVAIDLISEQAGVEIGDSIKRHAERKVDYRLRCKARR